MLASVLWTFCTELSKKQQKKFATSTTSTTSPGTALTINKITTKFPLDKAYVTNACETDSQKSK